MFYAQFVLSKKGPLSKIWLAAHWERKLSKAQIFDTNLQDAVEEIMRPKVKLSLRTTGHLLLGIVRIYSRKAKYVLADCNEAFLKIKMAFRPGVVENELREREDRAGGDIPDIVNDFYDVLPDLNDVQVANISHLPANQSRIDDITLREENFETSSQRNLAFDEELGLDDFGEKNYSNFGFEGSEASNEPRQLDFSDIEEGRRMGSDRYSFKQTTPKNVTLLEDEMPKSKDIEQLDNFPDDFGDDFGVATDLDLLFNENDLNRELDLGNVVNGTSNNLAVSTSEGDEMEIDQVLPQKAAKETQESFALEPLDSSALQQQTYEKIVRQKRKRRLVIDDYKNIRGDEMKSNMVNYSDTLQPLDLAPPTKLLMRLKENGVAEKLFLMPGCADAINDPNNLRFYQSHLVLYARDIDHQLREDIRRNLEMVDNLDETLFPHADDDYAPNSPFLGGNLIQDNFNDNENDENQATFNNVSLNGIDLVQTSINDKQQLNEPIIEEKNTSTRRSRIQEKEEENGDDDEDIFTKKTKNVLTMIAQKLRSNDKIYFDDILTRNPKRRIAVQRFYALLELHKRHAIHVEQFEPFGSIEIIAETNLNDTLAMTPQQ